MGEKPSLQQAEKSQVGSQESLGVEGLGRKTEMVGSMVSGSTGLFHLLVKWDIYGGYNPLILTSVPGHPSRRWMVGWVGVNVTSLEIGY